MDKRIVIQEEVKAVWEVEECEYMEFSESDVEVCCVVGRFTSKEEAVKVAEYLASKKNQRYYSWKVRISREIYKSFEEFIGDESNPYAK